MSFSPRALAASTIQRMARATLRSERISTGIWYVAPPTPMDGIYAAVTRRTLDDKNPGGWVPSQKISVEEALRAYTIDAAYAAFSEASLGSLEQGKQADLVVLERNLFEIPPEELNTVPIAATIVGGKVVYRNSATPASDGAKVGQ